MSGRKKPVTVKVAPFASFLMLVLVASLPAPPMTPVRVYRDGTPRPA